MERISDKEPKPYRFNEFFTGNWDYFKKVFTNPETRIYYDVDGILANSAKPVCEAVLQTYGIDIKPEEINDWSPFAIAAKAQDPSLTEEQSEERERFWYDNNTLMKSPRYLYMRSVVNLTSKLFGRERNFVLTSRDKEFQPGTCEWIAGNYPEIPQENVLTRDNSREIRSRYFKTAKLAEAAKLVPYVVFVDDHIEFVETVLNARIPNILVIHIPQGIISHVSEHPNLVSFKRFPSRLQAMYPLLDAINRTRV